MIQLAHNTTGRTLYGPSWPTPWRRRAPSACFLAKRRRPTAWQQDAWRNTALLLAPRLSGTSYVAEQLKTHKVDLPAILGRAAARDTRIRALAVLLAELGHREEEGRQEPEADRTSSANERVRM
jgi:hypothetical protein